MIYSITPNPALDLELCVDAIRFDQVLRAERSRVDCGGKGFNIARALAELGERCLALGLVGGKTGERLAEELARAGIETDLVWIQGETRTNIAILTPEEGVYIKVNQPGPEVSPQEVQALLDKVGRLAQAGDWWVLSGSLPPGAPPDTYRRVIQVIQAAGGYALVDADGENLRQACAAAPYLVKPNALEAGRYLGMEVSSPELAVIAARRFHNSGVRRVMITLGAEGALLSDGECIWWAKPPVIAVRSAIGAGDAALAGFVWGVSRGLELPEALRMGVASGTASASLPGTAVASRALLEEVARQVAVNKI